MKLTKTEAYFVNDIRQFADFLKCFERVMITTRELWQKHETTLVEKPSSKRNEITMTMVQEINRKVVAMEPIPYVRHDTTSIVERFKIYTNELFLLEQIQLPDLFRFVVSVYAPNTDIVRVNMLMANFLDFSTGAVNFNSGFIAGFRELIYSLGMSAHKDLMRSLPRPAPVTTYQGDMEDRVAIAEEKGA